MRIVRVQSDDFSIAAEIDALRAGRADIGAVATFTGYVRDQGGALSAMELEHYPGMTERALEEVAIAAEERWPLSGVVVIHRYGRLTPTDQIVLVVAASAHRQAAFEAAAFLMDYLKVRAPFWKREIGRDGEASWVDARESDDHAAARWPAEPK